jgi:hypothetical protein
VRIAAARWPILSNAQVPPLDPDGAHRPADLRRYLLIGHRPQQGELFLAPAVLTLGGSLQQVLSQVQGLGGLPALFALLR